ncbi:succinyldiaminopimelate transaminase [Thioalkalivibrio sp. XN279]|uniref:succinyldiaminopimelate transaminase n=1 Tax=Thioalkalivibrio sp. XN279 TaxID=2714953 RepID=UPI00140CEE15|nr:succinyldiaminopimelate transaminase [Thioalkalivibrio sp. XN279]NHA15306.1 succinyldiaminopimelate transaminase [Thioalkalivibrio sp. XN279]
MNPLLQRLHPYPFERLASLLADAAPPADRPHIGLSIGEPRHAPPAFVGAALCAHLERLGTYPTAAGLPSLRAACARWLERRFDLGVHAVDPETMVLPVNGTREGLFSFVQAALDAAAGGLVMMPNPFYQIYEGAALLAGAEPYYLDTTAATGFLPDLDAVPAEDWARCRVLFICSPGNPTGAVMDEGYLARVLALAEQYDFLVASDECYADIYLDEDRPPPGLLGAALRAGDTGFRRCVVFHSLSKRSSVPGLRSGFVAGDPEVMAAFRLYRTYHGCAVPEMVQLASIPAWDDDAHAAANRRLYQEKFDAVVPILSEVMSVERPEAAFYLWLAVPGDDVSFTRGLYGAENVTVLPGRYLSRDHVGGNPGAGRIRVSLVAEPAECIEAARRIARFVAAKR